MSGPSSSLINRGLNLTAGPIARASIAGLLIKLCAVGLSFLQAVVFARSLGPAGYGQLASLLSFAQIASTVAVFGLASYAIRTVPVQLVQKQPAELRAFTKFSLGFVIATSVAIILLAAIAWPFSSVLKHLTDQALWPALIIVMLFALTKMAAGVLRGLGKSSASMLAAEIVRPGLVLACIAALWGVGAIGLQTNAPPDLLLWIIAGASTFGLAISLIALFRALPARETTNATIPPPQHLRKAFPFFWLTLGALAMVELSTIMLAMLSSFDQVALYQPVARLSVLLTLPIQAVAVRYAPRAAEFHSAGEIARLRSISKKFTLATFLPMLVGGILLLAIGEKILALFGPEFVVMTAAFPAIIVAQLICAACGPTKMLLVACGKSKQALFGDVLAISVTATLSILLIPSYGALGAVWALCTAMVVANLLRVFQIKRELGFWPLSD